jgi:predicted TIM-barrel fold metal-dependent hydrolase
VDQRFTVISTDCHTGPLDDDMRAYLPRRYWDDFEEYQRRGIGATQRTESAMPEEALAANRARTEEGGGWYRDPDRRLKELEQDGIVAEVLFPVLEQADVHGRPPFLFRPSVDPGDMYGQEHQHAGAQAWNRSLADFCSRYPSRQAGVGVVTPYDIDRAVREIGWCKQAGLRGIILAGEAPELPGLNDPRYEPVWEVLEDCALPLHVHVGMQFNIARAKHEGGHADAPGGRLIGGFTGAWAARRELWVLIFGGVLDRHPGLHCVFTELHASWVVPVLQDMDEPGPRSPAAGAGFALRASDYWRRQCHIGASLFTRQEAELRHLIGVDTIMWGADYPHYEGTWPRSRRFLRDVFHDLPEEEVRRMLGGNAAALYGFDLDELDAIAATVGPTPAEIGV